MFRRNLWKILLSLFILAWAVFTLFPLKDTPPTDYARAHASANVAEFTQLLKDASDQVAAGKSQTAFVALKRIANERKIDLSKFFPEIQLETSLTNVRKRNEILMDELMKRSKGKLQLGLDLKGGVLFTLEVDEKAAAAAGTKPELRQQKLAKAVEIIGNRINGFGVSEPLIRPVGENRIEVQLPGVSTKDNPDVISTLQKPARLEFRLVHPTLTPASNPSGETPAGYDLMPLDDRENGTQSVDMYIKRIPEMTGEGIADAYPAMDQYGKFRIILKFTKEGSRRFAEVTGAIAQEAQRTGKVGLLAIVLDNTLSQTPSVREQINSDSAEITGNFSQREAFDKANILNNPLDLPLQIREQYEVGPSLAQDTIDSGIRAAIIGTALVAAFMITYYTIGGVLAVATLGINVLIILGVMASLGATMTLPGLAGIVLTIGMAVDANILIFERMREELALGKTLKASLSAGFDKAFTTILDAHITQLVICGVMIWLGTGPIKGFGVTLAIGVFSTMFSVLITSHMIMELLVESNIMTRFPMLHWLKNVKMDFVKYGKPAFIASWVVVLIGLATVIMKGDKIYGIDFAGGDEATLSFSEKVDIAKIRDAAGRANIGEVNPSYISDSGSKKEVLKLETAFGKSNALVATLQQSYPQANFKSLGENHIGPSIGKEIEKNALLSVALSLVAILIYVAFRFEVGFGMGAVVSTIHDILMTIGIFVVLGHQFTAPMVAAILSIAGYSINDTIVVFDRIREELKINPNGSLKDVINLAINRVFSRSMMTSLTAFLAALSLFIFGGGVVKDLSLTFLIGIVTGTFSSIFVASPIFYWWHKGDRKHVEAHHDVTPKYEWTGSSRASK